MVATIMKLGKLRPQNVCTILWAKISNPILHLSYFSPSQSFWFSYIELPPCDECNIGQYIGGTQCRVSSLYQLYSGFTFVHFRKRTQVLCLYICQCYRAATLEENVHTSAVLLRNVPPLNSASWLLFIYKVYFNHENGTGWIKHQTSLFRSIITLYCLTLTLFSYFLLFSLLYPAAVINKV